jgi:hypothetical protein
MAITLSKLLIKATSGLKPATAGGGAQTSDVLVDVTFASGTGVQQFDTPFQQTRTLGAGANENIDLQTALDDNGVALGYTGVRFFMIEADQGNGADIRLSPSANAATNGWTSWMSASGATDDPLADVEPGGFRAIGSARAVSPYTVSPTNKTINIENLDGANSVTYTITVWGF